MDSDHDKMKTIDYVGSHKMDDDLVNINLASITWEKGRDGQTGREVVQGRGVERRHELLTASGPFVLQGYDRSVVHSSNFPALSQEIDLGVESD